MSERATEIATLLAPTVAALRLELLGVEFVPSGAQALLRLYIDAGERTVTIEDCEAVSREVSAVLDVADPIASQYTLEVSSPGIDRPLFTAAQFARHVGEEVKLTLLVPIDARRRLQGSIVGVAGEQIALRVDAHELTVTHANIDKARIVPDWAALGLGNAAASKGKAGNGNKKGRERKRGHKIKHNDARDSSATEHER